ncbi:MAG: glycosyltransferase [Anaerolineales bacterium]
MSASGHRADVAVSVVMAAYNGRRFICEALQSLFAQSHPPAEIVVVDDGSTDGTSDVLQPYLDRIRYFTEPHRGLSAAWNWGIAQAHGELVAFLDADDYYLPEHLQRMAELLSSDPSAGLVHSGWRLVREDGAFICDVQPWRDAPRLDLKGWLFWKPARMGATLLRRRWLERAGGFDETFVQSEDVDLMLRLAVLGCKSIWLRNTTLCVRVHGDNMTRQGVVGAENLDQVLDRFFSLPGLPSAITKLERQVRHDTSVWTAWHLWQTGYRAQALARLQDCLASADWPPEQSALRWMIRFHDWDEGQGMSPLASLGTRSLLHEASGTSVRDWNRVQTRYDWFRRVWLPVTRGEPCNPDPTQREAMRDLSWSEFIAPILAGVPQPVDAGTVKTLWAELGRHGLVGAADRHEVTALYLSVFADSVRMRDWHRAWGALDNALGEGLSRVSLRAWLDFGRAEARGLTGRLRSSGGPPAHRNTFRVAQSVTMPPSKKGLVSVIIPAYNKAPYVTQAVKSVLGQDYPHREIIVVDDGSTDGTAEVLKAQAKELTYVHQSNQGPAAARNRGLRIAQGEFILFLDADDFLLPGALSAHIRQLLSHPSHGFSHSGWRFVDARGEPLADETPWKEVPRLDLENWLERKPVFLGAMMFRRSSLEHSGGFDTRLFQAEDVDLLFRLALSGSRGEWIRSVTVCRRKDNTNITRDSLGQARDLDAALVLFFGNRSLPRRIRRLERTVYFFTLMWISWYLIQAGQLDAAGQYLGRTQMYTRLSGKTLVLGWLSDLAERTRGEVSRAVLQTEPRALWPVFKRASKMGPAAWAQAERSLDFWVDIWRPYTNGDRAQGRAALSQFPPFKSHELVEYSCTALLEAREPIRLACLDQLWEDALQAAVVAPEGRPEVINLYLALAARALQRRWGACLLEVALPTVGLLAQPRGWGSALHATARLGREMAGRIGQWG